MRFGMAGVLLALFLPTFGSAQTPDTIRVCTYNILEYGDQSSDRDDELRMILNEIGPTVLFVQEISRVGDGSEEGASRMDLSLREESDNSAPPASTLQRHQSSRIASP